LLVSLPGLTRCSGTPIDHEAPAPLVWVSASTWSGCAFKSTGIRRKKREEKEGEEESIGR
jgi:hypothetical protein